MTARRRTRDSADCRSMVSRRMGACMIRPPQQAAIQATPIKEPSMSARTLLACLGMAICLASVPWTLSAATPEAPAAITGPAWCRDNPEACTEMRQRAASWCQENPAQCEKMKARMAERQAWCKDNAAACEQQRDKHRRRLQKMQEKCAADPARCEERRQRMRQRMDECAADPAGCKSEGMRRWQRPADPAGKDQPASSRS
ncbi:MAG: hypothetical protein H3C57_01225 [Gammaproteobacteria bacterium]|nr:hypothetical protein [Gammaproteobacteria bacterium]